MVIKEYFNRKHLYLAMTLCIMSFIFIQSALPANLSDKESGMIVLLLKDLLHKDAAIVSFIVRKCAHFSEYTFLGISLLMTVHQYSPAAASAGNSRIAVPRPLTAWICGTLYALSDELHQSFVPGRSCEARDVLIDSAGVLAGILIVGLIKGKIIKTLFRAKTPPASHH